MHPHEDASPVSAAAVASFELVFDAVYTPMDTTLLKVGASCVPAVTTPLRACNVHTISPHSTVYTDADQPC